MSIRISPVLIKIAMVAVLALATRSWAAEPGADEKHLAGAAPAGATASGEPAHDAHGGHVKIDDRLVPIPPSQETVVSAIWVVIIFVVLLMILYPTAWRGVLAGLKKREERIRNDIAEAEAARGRAEQTLKEYQARLAQAEQQVRDLIAKATAEGEQVAASIRTRAQQESEEAKERATRDIESARDQAIAELYEQAADLSVGVAEKILQRNINADDQRELVKRSLEQLQSAGKN
jgi:F-type H+-transporting ATPase subunit b